MERNPYKSPDSKLEKLSDIQKHNQGYELISKIGGAATIGGIVTSMITPLAIALIPGSEQYVESIGDPTTVTNNLLVYGALAATIGAAIGAYATGKIQKT
ncbi:hypothetical protein HOC01_01020 [archaeon]|jgi:hypothetical protein|nr:hypothetical protein [archaeon]MBT6698576.1 hypothetical protein [archaeon]